jgi:hypothetical protein
MKHRLVFHSLPLLALFLALTSTALASSTWYVNGVNGSDNNNCKTPRTACRTIGHAISLASSGDSIMIAAATYTENLTISFSLKLVGSGAATTIIDGGGVNRVVTTPNSRANVTLSKLTIRNGHFGFEGGGMYNAGTLTINNSTISANQVIGELAFGGGIFSSGKLTINNSTLSGNSATAQQVGFGGGIAGGVTINNTTISGNTVEGLTAHGGGIFGTATVNNSTISGNSASASYGQAYGGGISGGTATINNSTINGNSAKGRQGSHGGGIYNGGTATLQNSIVANSPSGGNCSGTMTSNGYTLSSDGTCNFSNTGDLNNTDPKLGQLGNYGGPTQTMPLLSASPAIDAGNPSGCADGHGHLLKTDQRGRPRPDKEDTSGCDRGAYERQKD